MPFAFLDLPRELRELIYAEVLISLTGHVVPVFVKTVHVKECRPLRQSTLNQQLRTVTQRLQLLPCTTACNYVSRKPIKWPCYRGVSYHPVIDSQPLTTSLCRVNHQLYAETKGILWRHNTVCFPNSADAVKLLEYMGKCTSFCIERIQLCIGLMTPYSDHSGLEKALSMLSSCGRRGALREVELSFDKMHEWTSVFCSAGATPRALAYNNELLDLLVRGKRLTWTSRERNIIRRIILEFNPRVFKTPAIAASQCAALDDAAQVLHQAWGGELTCNGTMIREDKGKVGEIDLTIQMPRDAGRLHPIVMEAGYV